MDQLLWRGRVANSTDQQALAEHLAAGPATFYVGFDPTAETMRMGYLAERGPTP
jgi:tyrosyl-tRNA synthetase